MFGFDEGRDNYNQVYQSDNQSSLGHEVIAGGAAFAAFHEFEKHQRNEGKTVSHGFAKELLAGFAGAEVDKLAETKGEDFFDREKAKHQAKRQSEELYDQHYGIQYENGFVNNHSCVMNPRSNILQERTGQEENIKELSSSSSTRIVGSMQANQGRFIDDRLIEREVWKEMWRERVRRSRDARRSTRILDDERRDCEGQRVARNAFQRRKNDLEKEALSFDYSFWRAEQVVAENYHLSDVSMCIATYSAKPLGEADIDILSCAALAGPLLAATVSHVNKQHSSHNL